LLANILCNDERGLADNAARASLADSANKRSPHGFTLPVTVHHYHRPRASDGCLWALSQDALAMPTSCV